MIITISREFGSGGKEIGKRLSDALNIAYYDENIISLVSKDTGMSKKYINNISENGIYPNAFQFARSFTTLSGVQSSQVDILISQQKVIKKIAEKGNCVIVGRGANSILKEYNTFDIFVYANMESKLKRCREKAPADEHLTEKEMIKKIKEIDKSRQKYHEFISDNEWGKKENYNICINTSNVEIKKIIPALKDYIKNYYGGDKK